MTPRQTVKNFGAQLSAACHARGLSLRELAQLAGVSHEAVRSILSGEAKTIAPLIAVAGRLGYRLALEAEHRGSIIQRVADGTRVPNDAEKD